MKKCTKCKEEKELDQFNNDSSKVDGKQSICKSCQTIYNKKRWKDNKEHIVSLNKKWKDKNPQYYIDYSKEYEQKNKVQILEYHKQYNRIQYINNPLFKLKDIISTAINLSMNNNGFKKNSRSHEILGCEWSEFKLHLESKFEPWMSWDNQGNPKDGILEFNKTWDLDHIIPISSANTEEDVIRLNHFSNFQPLCSKVNREIKRNKL